MNNYGSRHPPIFNVESRTGYASMNPYSYFFGPTALNFCHFSVRPSLSLQFSVVSFIQEESLQGRCLCMEVCAESAMKMHAVCKGESFVCKEDANSGRQEAEPCMPWHGLCPGAALRAGRWFLLVTLCEDGICREHVVPKVSKHWTLALVRRSAHSQLGLSAAPSAPWCARRLQPGAGVTAANAAPITHISSLYW